MGVLVLFDVDDTLIDNGGVSKRVYANAGTDIIGHRTNQPANTWAVRIDRSRPHMLMAHGLTSPPWAVVRSAHARAGAANEELLHSRGRVLPRARSALDALTPLPGTVVSALNNIRSNARLKLGAFDLDQKLDLSVGAFAEQSEDRATLVPAARARTVSRYPHPSDALAVVVSDNPRDVQAARDAQAYVVAAATGVHSAAELSSASADMVLEDLSDTSSFMSLVKALAV